ncbi:MAG: carboxypeptidase-like regulatory domain-containing protein [Gelidibacter sp.]|nr:carboxypeptidase-like regulatory domain-containing protein [Gelidibacter sp.]
MKTKYLFFVCLLMLFFSTSYVCYGANYFQEQPKETFTEYRGMVVDRDTKDPLAFVTITVNDTQISTITNTEGEFLLKVPNGLLDKDISVTFLGYTTKVIPLSDLNGEEIQILLDIAVTQLSEVNIIAPKDALTLVRAALDRKGNNYFNEQSTMTAFYRESIKKRRRDASLSEAVVEINKQPYKSTKTDVVKLIKARKSTNYGRLDTLALKLQGGPYTALYADFLKYPEYIFTDNTLSDYEFSFDKSTEIDNKSVYVVKFKQKPSVIDPLYYGKLYIDAQTFALTSAIYNLNIENSELAADMFVRKKPNKVTVIPLQAAYRVDYRTIDGQWYYGYSYIQLIFKVDWKGRWFNSVYSLNSEMVITDVSKKINDETKSTQLLKPTVILSDEASGFSDPNFWGEYNIIEPEKSIESAISKISKQLKKS